MHRVKPCATDSSTKTFMHREQLRGLQNRSRRVRLTDLMGNLTDKQLQEQVLLLTRGCEGVYTQQELEHRLREAAKDKRQLRIKYGMDPTAPDIHLGHAVQMRKLRMLQDMGHRIILIIGDYTAMIGDPSGRDATRPMLDPDTINSNAQTYLNQAGGILDTDPDKLELRRNSEWLEPLSYSDILRLTGMATVQQMIARESFRNRIEAGREVIVTELLYPLVQGYDSIAINADIEFGGSDQTFNCLLGRDMMAKSSLPRQIVLITPLLVGLDGVEKMSKSKGNYIGVTDAPNEMFGKVMSIPDTLMDNYFTLLTDLPRERIDVLLDDKQTHPRDAKVTLGKIIVETYHGKDLAESAAAEFAHVFAEKQNPRDIPEILTPTDKMNVVELITLAKFAKSTSDARRLVTQNAVSLDGNKITDIDSQVELRDGQVLRVGKKRFGQIRLANP